MTILKSNKGFSLTELLIVFSLIGILFMLLVPEVNSYFIKSQETSVRTDFRTFQQSAEMYLGQVAGKNLNEISLNQFLDSEHEMGHTGEILTTKSKDSWGNSYVVEFGEKKISFYSLGKEKNPSVKKYQLTSYFYNGVKASCTIGFQTGNIEITTIKNLPSDFICGSDISQTSTLPIATLTAPSNFVVTDVTQTKIDLNWDSVAGATHYILKRDETIIYTGNNTSFSDITLEPTTSYEYKVAAKNSATTSSYSTLSQQTDSPLPPPIPNTPTNFIATNITDTTIDLSWDSMMYSTSYTVYRDGVIVYTGSNISYTDSGLTPNTNYTYSVNSFNAYGNKSPATVSAKTKPSSTTVSLPSEGSGSCSDPYIITTIGELQAMNLNSTACYELGNNIDASATSTWNSGKGFIPIQNGSTGFSGVFDGKNFKIMNLSINRPLEDNVGLFGRIRGGTVRNLGLENVNIVGRNFVGGLSGYIWENNIEKTYTTGTVIGLGDVGGLAGGADETHLLNNFSRASVTSLNSSENVGGLVGSSCGFEAYDIYYNYSTGKVTNGYGLVGGSSCLTYYNSFWDKDTSTQNTSFAGVGKTTAQMKQQSTYTGWDFVSTWAIHPSINDGYPYLRENVPTD